GEVLAQDGQAEAGSRALKCGGGIPAGLARRLGSLRVAPSGLSGALRVGTGCGGLAGRGERHDLEGCDLRSVRIRAAGGFPRGGLRRRIGEQRQGAKCAASNENTRQPVTCHETVSSTKSASPEAGCQLEVVSSAPDGQEAASSPGGRRRPPR